MSEINHTKVEEQMLLLRCVRNSEEVTLAEVAGWSTSEDSSLTGLIAVDK